MQSYTTKSKQENVKVSELADSGKEDTTVSVAWFLKGFSVSMSICQIETVDEENKTKLGKRCMETKICRYRILSCKPVDYYQQPCNQKFGRSKYLNTSNLQGNYLQIYLHETQTDN